MKIKVKKWIFETKCCRCGKLNGWIFNPNNNEPTEKEKAFHRLYYHENPFSGEWCNHCDMETRQEWVCLYEQKTRRK